METVKKEGRVVESTNVKFVQQCQLSIFDGESSLFSSKIQRRYSCLVCSSKYGIVFVIHPIIKELVVFKSKKIDVFSASKSTRSGVVLNKQSLEAKTFSLSTYFTELSHLAMSADELILVVCGNDSSSRVPVATLFSIPDIVESSGAFEALGSIQLANDPSIFINAVTARPLNEPEVNAQSALIVLSNNSLCLISLQKNPGILGTLPSNAGINCVSWSRKGKQFVVGDKQGRLVRFEPNGMTPKGMIAPPNQGLYVCDVLWLDNYNYAVAYFHADASNPQPQTMFVNAKGEQPSYTDFGDICYGTDDDLSHPRQYLFLHVHEWKLVLALSQSALEGSVLSFNQAEMSWEQLLVDDETARLTFPADPTAPSYPVGMALSLLPDHPSVVPSHLADDPQAASKISPSPLLLVATTTGTTMAYSMVNAAPDAISLSKNAVELPKGSASSVKPVEKPVMVSSKPQPVPQNTVFAASQNVNFNKVLETPKPQTPIQPPITQPSKPVNVEKTIVLPPQPQNHPGVQKPAELPKQQQSKTNVALSQQTRKFEIEEEMDAYVASKLAEEIAAINNLYAVWSKSVKPLVEKEKEFTMRANSDQERFSRLVFNVDSQIDGFRASLADLEGNFKLLSVRLVDGLARSEEIRIEQGAPSSPQRRLNRQHSALSPKPPPNVTVGISSNLRDRLKKSSENVSHQLFASCTQQLNRLREMNKILDTVYDRYVERMCGESSCDTENSQSLKNIYGATYGLQKAVHLQKTFIGELSKKIQKLKQRMAASGSRKTIQEDDVKSAHVQSYFRNRHTEDYNAEKLTQYLMYNHRVNWINVAPQPKLSEIGKNLPKPPLSIFAKKEVLSEVCRVQTDHPKIGVTVPNTAISKSVNGGKATISQVSSNASIPNMTAVKTDQSKPAVSKAPPNVSIQGIPIGKAESPKPVASQPQLDVSGLGSSKLDQPKTATNASASKPEFTGFAELSKTQQPGSALFQTSFPSSKPTDFGFATTETSSNTSPAISAGFGFSTPSSSVPLKDPAAPSLFGTVTKSGAANVPSSGGSTFNFAPVADSKPVSSAAFNFATPSMSASTTGAAAVPASTNSTYSSLGAPPTTVTSVSETVANTVIKNSASTFPGITMAITSAPVKTTVTSAPATTATTSAPVKTTVTSAPATTAVSSLTGLLGGPASTTVTPISGVSNQQRLPDSAPVKSTSAISGPFGAFSSPAVTTVASSLQVSTTTSSSVASSNLSALLSAPVSSNSESSSGNIGKSSAPSMFGSLSTAATTTTTSATPSLFGSFASASAPSATAVNPAAPSLFGSVPSVTSTSSTAPTTTAPSSLFGVLPSTTTASSSSYVTSTATSAGFSFAAPPSTKPGETSTFNFETPAASISSTTTTTQLSGGFSFAAPVATTSTGGFSFGSAQTSASSSLFGQPSTTVPSSGFSFATPASTKPSSEPLFGGMFASSMSDIGKPNTDKSANSSGPFGFASTTSVSPAMPSAQASVFAQPNTPSSTGTGIGSFGQKPAGGLFSASVLNSAVSAVPAVSSGFSFGQPQKQAQQPASASTSAFGGAPAFGSSPSFGGAPSFGQPQGFGASPGFAASPAFGSSSQPSGFGSLAQSNPAGSSASIFGGGGGSQSGFAALASTGTGAFGSSGNSPSAPSFTQYRS